MYQDALRLLEEKVRQGEYQLETKTRRVCPECQNGPISKRKKMIPLYRCNICANEFEEPLEIQIQTGKVSR